MVIFLDDYENISPLTLVQSLLTKIKFLGEYGEWQTYLNELSLHVEKKKKKKKKKEKKNEYMIYIQIVSYHFT